MSSGELLALLSKETVNPSEVELLLSRGANIHDKDEFGYTPLIIASMCGYMSAVQLLLLRGANYSNAPKEDICKKWPLTMLLYCCQAKCVDIPVDAVEMLGEMLLDS